MDQESALFMNGMFEQHLVEILDAEAVKPRKWYYLQPYSPNRIKLLAEGQPTVQQPIPVYFSLTDSLNTVSYRAACVGWQDKRALNENSSAAKSIEREINRYQPSVGHLYLVADNGKQYVNLIQIRGVQRLNPSFSASFLVKVSDGVPLGERSQSGGWVPVRNWLPTVGPKLEVLDSELRRQVSMSLNGSAAARMKRLAIAPKMPERIEVVTFAYRRNPDVIAEVLKRAGDKCEDCKRTAPFLRSSDNSPYLEVHHIKMLSEGGEDTTVNARALCPNCHRKRHFGG